MNENIQKLKAQIAAEEQKIANCKHLFGEAFYDPETQKIPSGYRLVGQGSDTWSEATGYHDAQINRWTRVCQKCGFRQHTYEQEPVVSSYRPKFS